MAFFYFILKKVSGWYVILFFIWFGWRSLEPGADFRQIVDSPKMSIPFYVAIGLFMIKTWTMLYEEDMRKRISALLEQGAILKNQGDYETALNQYNKAAQLNKTWRGPMQLYFERGMLYKQMGRCQEALNDLTKFSEMAKSINSLATHCDAARAAINELQK
jgi:tetratricopeptide (TPR) repeat protein